MKKLLNILVLVLSVASISSFRGMNYNGSARKNGIDTIPYTRGLSGYGYYIQRIIMDSGFVMPNGDTTFGTDQPRVGAMMFRTVGGDSTLYLRLLSRWVKVGTSGGLQQLSKNLRGDSILLSGGGEVQDRDTQQLSIAVGPVAGDTLKLDRSNSVILNYLARNHFIDSLNANRQVLGYNATTGKLWIYPPANDTVTLNTAPVLSVNGKIGAVVLTTDSVAEGAVNLYFTTQRVRNAITGSSSITFNNATGSISTKISSVANNDIVLQSDGLYVANPDSLFIPKSGGITTGPIYYGLNPVSNNELVNKNYVDSKVIGLSWKQDVKVATTANIGLSGIITPIDGVVMSAGDRVLVKNQTDSTQNGIYTESSTAWSRSADMNTGANILASAVFVQVGGTMNGGTQWVNTNTGTINIGSTGIFFTQFNGGATYVGINGVNIVGANISLDTTFVHNHFYSNAATGITYSNGLYALAAIPNTSLSNSTISGTALGGTLPALTIGTGLSGGSYNATAPVTIANTGVLSNIGGTGISITGATGNSTITNTGIISASAGSGISVSGTNPLLITNTGVLNVNGNTGAISMDTTYIPNFWQKVRGEISLTTTGNSGSATYSNVTGILNVPAYTLAGLGGQPAGNYITALTGDGTASGPGSAVFTLAASGVTAGGFTRGIVNAKGLITSATDTAYQVAGSYALTNGSNATGTWPISITGSAATLSAILSSTLGGSGVNNAGTLTWGAGGTLGSNAYTSTAYLPLTGGTLTGALTAQNLSSNGFYKILQFTTTPQNGNGGEIYYDTTFSNPGLVIQAYNRGPNVFKPVTISGSTITLSNLTVSNLISAPFVATNSSGTFIPAAYTPYNPASYPVNAGGETLQSVTTRGATTTLGITALKFITSGGLSTQFVKGDGSLDGTVYTPTNGTGASGTWGISITGTANPNPGSGNYIQNTNVQQPSSNLNISGTGDVGSVFTSHGGSVIVNAGTNVYQTWEQTNTSSWVFRVANADSIFRLVRFNSNGAQSDLYDWSYTGNYTNSGTITASGFYNSSDTTLKNIYFWNPSRDGIESIIYSWKKDPTNKSHWGYAAQQVQKILPNAVIMGTDNKLKVDYNEVHTYKIAALEEENKQLTEKVDSLESRLDTMQKEIEQIKKQIHK